MYNFLTGLQADKMRMICKNIVEKFLRNNYKVQRMNRLTDSIEIKDNSMNIRGGQIQLKESSLEDLLNDGDKLSPR